MVRDQSRPDPPADSGWVSCKPHRTARLAYTAILIRYGFLLRNPLVPAYQGSESRQHLGSSLLQRTHSKRSLIPPRFLFPRQQVNIPGIPNPLTTGSAYKWKYRPLTHSPHPHHRPNLPHYLSGYRHFCLSRIKRRGLRLQFETVNHLETGSRNMNTTMKPKAGSAASPDYHRSTVLKVSAAQVPPAPVHIHTHAHAHICILVSEYTLDTLLTPQNDATI